MDQEVEKDKWRPSEIFSSAIFILVLLMLIFNIVALVISIPYVFSNVPQTYDSRIEGKLDIPYYPSGEDEFRVELEEEQIAGRSFHLVVNYSNDSPPYTDPWVVFHGPDDKIFKLGTHLLSGSWVSDALIPGLDPGIWGVDLLFGPNPEGAHRIRTELYINVSISDPGWLKPVLPTDMTVDNELIVGKIGEIPDTSGFQLKIDGNPVNLSIGGIGEEHSIDLGGYDHGWHWLTVRGNGSSQSDYLFYIDTGEGHLAPVVTFERVMTGHEEAFDKKLKGDPIEGPGNYELNPGTVYKIVANYSGISDGSDKLPEELRIRAHHPRLMVRLDNRSFPLKKHGFSYSYSGYLFTPYDPEQGDEPEIIPVEWSSGLRARTLDVSYSEDYLPEIEFDSLPWSVEGVRNDTTLEISSGPFQLGYRDFKNPPSVTIETAGAKEPLQISEVEGEFWPRYRVDLNSTQVSNGGEMTILAEASFQYYEILTLIIPIPPFIIGIGPALFGWEAVVWFCLIFTAITASTYYLFHRDYRGIKSNDMGSRIYKIVKDPGRDANRTFWAFLGILFFSFAVSILFQLMEQETPGLSILSEDVPVWYRMMILSNASVWEEISLRFLLIGVPLFFIRSLSRDGYGSVTEALSERGWKFGELLGGGGKFDVWSVSLILLTAVLFGFAHIGWGLWKVLPTFVSGLIFGYLFVRVGLHAAIVVHFLIDYSSFLPELVNIGSMVVTMVFMIGLALGGIFLAVALVEILFDLLEKYDIKTPPEAAFLVIHSVFSIALGSFILYQGSLTLSLIFLQAPFLGGLAYLLDRKGASRPAYAVSFVSSLLTLTLAPVGMAWIAAKWHERGVVFRSRDTTSQS